MLRRIHRMLGFVLRPLPDARDRVEILVYVFVYLVLPIIGGFVPGQLAGFRMGVLGAAVTVAAVALLLLCVAAYRYQTQIESYEARPKPRFVFDRPYTDRRQLYQMERTVAANFTPQMNVAGLVQQPIAQPFFCHVRISNNPQRRVAEATAKDVIARISFFDESGETLLFKLDGRWGGGTQQPSQRSPFEGIEDLPRMDFPPNGEWHELDIAIKYEDDDDGFGFSNESFRLPDWKKPEWTLRGDVFRVRVRLQGTNVEDEARWFTLRNKGKGSDIELSSQDDGASSS